MRIQVALLLIAVAFLLGMLGERWLHGDQRERALREYEQAVEGLARGEGRPGRSPVPR